jgi:hypothetical protein
MRLNSVNIVHSANKVVNPHKEYYHYVGGVPHSFFALVLISSYLYCLCTYTESWTQGSR